MDAADDSPLTTAARELKEETGCSGGTFRLPATLLPNPATHTNRVYIVLTQAVVHTRPATPDVTENIEVVRVSAAEATALALRGDTARSQDVGLLMIRLKAANLIERLPAGHRAQRRHPRRATRQSEFSYRP